MMVARALVVLVVLLLCWGLPGSASPPPLVLAWQLDVGSAHSLCVGDLGPKGQQAALVTDEANVLTVVSAAGKKVRSFAVPRDMDQIEVGHLGPGKPVVLGFRSWGPTVSVISGEGHQLWSVPCPQGVNCARWADLDQNGKDELVVGFNGGGLRVLNGDGKPRWEKAEPANPYNLAVLKSKGRTLLFVTGPSGDILRFDARGNLQSPIRPDDLAFAPMVASESLILAQGEETSAAASLSGKKNHLVASDADGEVQWRRALSDPFWTWQVPRVAWNSSVWAFFTKSDMLTVVNSAGRDLASLRCENVERFAVLTRSHQSSLVLLLSKGMLSAYSLPH